MNSANILLEWAGREEYEQGLRLYHEGLVTAFTQRETQGIVMAKGTVGSQQVELGWDGKAISCNQCSCGRSPCHHQTALVLALQENQKPKTGYALIYRIALAKPRQAVERWPDLRLQVQVERARLRRDGSLGMTEPISMWGVDLPNLGTISKEDQALIGLLRKCPRAESPYAPSFAEDVLVPTDKTDEALRLLVSRPYLWDRRGVPITVQSHSLHVGIRIALEGNGLVITPALEGHSTGEIQIIDADKPWAMVGSSLAPIQGLPADGEVRRFLRGMFKLSVERLQELPLGRMRDAGLVILGLQGEEIQNLHCTPPVGILRLEEVGEELVAHLAYGYEGIEVSMGDPRPLVVENGLGILRDTAAETRIQGLLKQCGLMARSHGFVIRGEEALEFLFSNLPKLLEQGWKSPEAKLDHLKVAPKAARITMRIKTGLDWFSLQADSPDLAQGAFESALQSQRRFVQTEKGWMRIPDKWLKSYISLKDALGCEILNQRIPLFQAPMALSLVDSADKEKGDEGWSQLAERLRQLSGIEEAAIPDGFEGELRPYQRHGLAFMGFLKAHGFHGILADDMGLGKTIQAIAMLLIPSDGPKLPSLIIAPTSVVYNWQDELKRFAPGLKVLSLQGPHRQEHFDNLGCYDIILTSFALLRRDWMHLEKQDYCHIILDEAQAIKNASSLTSKLVRKLNGRHRFSLTGTPLENHPGELWSQFAFLMPGLLGSEKQFQERYLAPIATGDTERLHELRTRISPFILRRLKKEVAKDLPARSEIVSYCELYPEQRELYERILLEAKQKITQPHGNEMAMLDALLRLRQVCCHPQLLDPTLEDCSAKLDHFMELVHSLIAEGHRALVFSQFVKMLELVKKRLNEAQIPYEYLDGHTRDRQARVERFNHSDVPLFLISLKAGGTGLNLTGADYVIHFDPWWNPAVEAQATDRAHRIGQSRSVFSYKLIARDSIEEKVLLLQDRKRAMTEGIILSEEGVAKQLTREDLEFLFK